MCVSERRKLKATVPSRSLFPDGLKSCGSAGEGKDSDINDTNNKCLYQFCLMIVRMVLSVLADSSGSGLFAAAAGVCQCSRRHDAKFVVNFQVHLF